MKKALLGLIIVVVLVLGGGLYYLFSNLDAIVKAVIEDVGSQTTQTAVRVDKVKIDLGEGSASIRGLTVANPKGFSAPRVFSLGVIGTKINLASLTSDVIVIDKITIGLPQIYYEMKADKSDNLRVLQANIAQAMPKTGSSTQKADPETGEAPLRLRIRRLVFTGGTIYAQLAPLDNKKYEVKLPRIEMSNLGGRSGATPDAIAYQVLRKLTQKARQAVKDKVVDKYLNKAKAKLEAKKEEAKSRARQKAKDKVKSLFKR